MRKINKNINSINVFNVGNGDVASPSPDNVETPSSEDSSSTTSSGNKIYKDDKDDYDYTSSDEINLNGIEYITRNKKLSYFDNGVQSVSSPEETMSIVDKTQKNTGNNFNDVPPGYYDYIQYEHRKTALSFLNNSSDEDSVDKIFRIGDCYFLIPPEFVTVSTVTSNDSIQALRQSGSIQMKHGYHQKEIQVKLVLNGMNQINGYEVESPFSYKYYVDGLRTLISQFKYTPFVPIENTLINLIHGVHAVSLRNITVETIEGFPEALSLTISMQEFNTKSYMGIDESLFGDLIDWDLYRYYTQLPLKKGHKNYFSKITTPTLTNDFQIKLLREECLGAYKLNKDGSVALNSKGEPIVISSSDADYINNDIVIDITNELYYNDIITSRDNIKMTGMSFSMGNTMPMIQMSAHEFPTTQYLGATDTVFSFSFETLDEGVAATFNELNAKLQRLILNNKEKSGIGFVKINNELVNLTGTSFLLISSIVVSTVPGFPGLQSITLECISYDSNQKENERLIALNPFENNRKGTKDDLITQDPVGYSNKILQDAQIEKKLLEIEVYPDLSLPTYTDVDSAITRIRQFRIKNNLIQQMSIDKMPRDKCEVAGSIKVEECGKYVDPDFYVMYPLKLTDLGPMGAIKETVGDSVDKNNSKKSSSNSFLDIDIDNVNSINISKFSKSTIMEAMNKAGDKPLSMFNTLKPLPVKVTEPEYAYGYEPDEKDRISNTFLNNTKNSDEDFTPVPQSSGGSINNSSYDPTTVKKRYGNPFVDLLCDRADAKCGYVYGSDGQIYNSTLKAQYESRFGASEYNGENETSQWFGKQVFDCSGFICWALRKVGYKNEGFRMVSGAMGSLGSEVPLSEVKCGDIFYNGSHCGVCLGDGRTVEAMNSTIGVAYGNVSSRYSFVRPTGLKETCDRFLSSNRYFYGNTSSGNLSTVVSGNITSSLYSTDSNLKAKLVQPKAPQHIEFDNGSINKFDILNAPVLANFGNNDPCDKWNTEISKVAESYNFDPNFIKVIIKIESNGNNYAISQYDPPNIVGLMQVYLTYHKNSFKTGNYFDAEDNINVGCKILADYGSADWVNYDLEKLLCCYNAGPGNAKSVFVYGTKAMPSETTKYVEKYKNYYSQLVANGAKAGNRISPKTGGVSGAITGDGLSDGVTISSSDWEYNYDESDFKNPNSGQERNGGDYGIDIDLFGTSVLNFISVQNNSDDIYSKDKNKVYSLSAKNLAKKIKEQNKVNVIEHMYHDMVQYSNTGKLSRAFPGFLFVILDEQADFIDEKKLWTNYYVYRSVIDISIHESYDNPIHTAKVTLSNFHNNLSKIVKTISTKDMLDDGFVKVVYNFTGAIIDEYISDKMLALKNILRDELYLYEGARVHIRLGYGSNLSRYPTTFNGTITNIEHGELVTLLAQSDGVELVNQPITDKSNQTNKDADLPEETSNMIARMFTARENEFINKITGGKFKINSKHGIEHFGSYMNSTYKELNGDEANGLPDGLAYEINIFDQSQFDLVQNIYKGTYKGVPFAAPSTLGFDGETNWRFFASGKTVWDILKMCEKSMPEFVCYPRYFGFESRIFFGLPSWIYNYKYEINNKNGDLYTRGKTFRQVHIATSLYSIIDNNIKVDTRGLYTNFIGSYTIAGDISTTPVIMSDYKIDWGRQKTKTIDTTSCWDVKLLPNLVEKFFEWAGKFDNGKELAIRVCLSELAISWKETYSGNLLMLGQPEIKVYDSLYLDDNFLNMSGQVNVREVVHSMSISSGFTTSIVPALVVFNRTHQSGMINVHNSTKALNHSFSLYVGFRALTAVYTKSVSLILTTSRALSYLKAYKTVNFLSSKGRTIYSMIRNGKVITQSVNATKAVKALNAANAGVKAGKLANIGSKCLVVTEGAVGAAATTPPGWVVVLIWVVVEFLLGFIITALHDAFGYRKCIEIDPLVIVMPNGNVKAYVGNVSGGVNLLPIKDTTQ